MAFQPRVSPVFAACPSLSLEKSSAEAVPGSAQNSETWFVCFSFVSSVYTFHQDLGHTMVLEETTSKRPKELQNDLLVTTNRL